MTIRYPALCLSAIAATLVCTTPTHAGYPYGTGVPITVPTDNVFVTLHFDHTAALYTGNLYFAGSGDANNILNPAPNTDATNQGFFAFNNHTSVVGSSIVVPGTFNAGDVLHFVYDIVAPSNALTDVLRTDVEADQIQFAWDPENSFFAVEDIREADGSDLDFNDIVIGVEFTIVPAPGALALLGAAALVANRRRRK